MLDLINVPSKVDHKTITMLANYVLILPDPQLDTAQIKGRETNLIVPDFKYENGERISIKERNASVFGTVYSAPSFLLFNKEKIKRLTDSHTLFYRENGHNIPVNIGIHRRIAELTKNSVLYDTDVEVNVGDRVNFSYTAHKIAKNDKMIFDTELGEMYLIKYDMLYMTVDENYKPKKMLNGYVLAEPEEIEVKKESTGQEFIEHASGLVTLVPKNKIKKTRKTQKGTVKLFGTRNRGYLQEVEKTDFKENLGIGQKIIYDPRRCQKLEYETHQIMSDKTLHLIHRKDIIMYDGMFGSFIEFDKIGIKKEDKDV